MTEKLKGVATILLLVCFVLPMSQCSGNENSERSAIENLESESNYFSDYNFILTEFDLFDVSSWLMVFAFIWPVVFRILFKGYRKFWFNILEIAFCIFTITRLLGFLVLSAPMIGWFIGVLAILCYLVAACVELVKSMFLFYRRARSA